MTFLDLEVNSGAKNKINYIFRLSDQYEYIPKAKKSYADKISR